MVVGGWSEMFGCAGRQRSAVADCFDWVDGARLSPSRSWIVKTNTICAHIQINEQTHPPSRSTASRSASRHSKYPPSPASAPLLLLDAFGARCEDGPLSSRDKRRLRLMGAVGEGEGGEPK